MEGNRGGQGGVDRRGFVKTVGLGVGGLATLGGAKDAPAGVPAPPEDVARLLADADWPSLKHYDAAHLARVALPIGGIGTGTVSLGGRGDLRDFELMNRPAKGFVPTAAAAPFFAVRLREAGRPPVARVLEGPLPADELEGSHGSPAPNAGLPRFRSAAFASAYPFGRVLLTDPDLPVEAHLKAMNPLVPADAGASGLPIAVFRVELRNHSTQPVEATVCASLPNFVGMDGSKTKKDWKGDPQVLGAAGNRNAFRRTAAAQGLFLTSEKVDPKDPAWGSIALVTAPDAGSRPARAGPREAGRARSSTSGTTSWPTGASTSERLAPRTPRWPRSPSRSTSPPARHARRSSSSPGTSPTASRGPRSPTRRGRRTGSAITTPRSSRTHGTSRRRRCRASPSCTAARRRSSPRSRASDLPAEVKEAALFNLSTLRTQTCFRTADGRFYGWEGCADTAGCCHGSCTHVWNYEQATPFLFGSLSLAMREVEFGHATSEAGLMSFRVALPIGRAQEFGRAAADGQMGCILKMYRDWQLSGDEALLRSLWPKVRKAVEFCWIPGGWDADRDGVMEGCQHNTMDVEYFGPNPQMGLWYLGALRAAEEMARHVGDVDFARECRRLFESGSRWIDANLWNGEYYVHRVAPPKSKEDVAPGLVVGMGAGDVTKPDYQLGAGCLVDQLVGQFVADVCGLGPLVDPAHARETLRSILRYNLRPQLHDHFNNMRAFAVADESALVMADYPKDRPARPFPYFGEAMTGFEYVAAVGMLYAGMEAEGLRAIRAVRARYDGARRSPFDEAECGHHYARAMASWAAALALTGFRWSAVTGTLELAARPGRHFWSNGSAWGTFALEREGDRALRLRLSAAEGELSLGEIRLAGFGSHGLPSRRALKAGETLDVVIPRSVIPRSSVPPGDEESPAPPGR